MRGKFLVFFPVGMFLFATASGALIGESLINPNSFATIAAPYTAAIGVLFLVLTLVTIAWDHRVTGRGGLFLGLLAFVTFVVLILVPAAMNLLYP